jgi:hypothetical protein
MGEVAAELYAMLVPRPEGAPMADTSDLERRITAMTEIHRRRDDDRSNFYNNVGASIRRLTEEVAQPNYRDLASRLPTFGAYDPVQIEPPRKLVYTTSVYSGDSTWAGSLRAPGNVGVSATLGYHLRVHDDAGRCTIAALIHVNRHNQGRGRRIDVLEYLHETVIGTAQFETAVAEIFTAFAACIPKTLDTVARALEDERQEVSDYE